MPLIIESECNTINLREEAHIPAAKVLLVSRDLNARARVEAALPESADLVTAPSLGDVPSDVKLVLLDLDAGGRESLDRVAVLQQERPEVRWVGFYSHVDEELGAAAGDAGIEALPRGRFWRQLTDLLADG